MEKVLARFAWLSGERAIGNTNNTWVAVSSPALTRKNHNNNNAKKTYE
jgi:hypothetical protein